MIWKRGERVQIPSGELATVIGSDPDDEERVVIKVDGYEASNGWNADALQVVPNSDSAPAGTRDEERASEGAYTTLEEVPTLDDLMERDALANYGAIVTKLRATVVSLLREQDARLASLIVRVAALSAALVDATAEPSAEETTKACETYWWGENRKPEERVYDAMQRVLAAFISSRREAK